MNVGSTEVEEFSDADRHLVEILGANTEAALERAARDAERRHRERRLERQNRRLDRFASVLSHDLRNPLNVAELGLEMAREQPAEEHFETVESAHERMETLIDDVLTLARNGGTLGTVESVSVPEVVRDAWGNVETDGASLRVEGEATVEADRSRLSRLFENLFRNAVEHAGPGVEVAVGHDDDRFYVADDGPGIDPADRDRVLDLDFSGTGDGPGFGLAIVAEIVEAHGWTLEVGSSPSGGAKIVVSTAGGES